MRSALLALLAPALLLAEAGVLIPSGQQEPNPAILSIAEMDIRIRIDNGHAVIHTRQIFASRSNAVLEGTYTFALPGRALVSDFAVWDDVTRIPGVILERRRAEEIYEIAKAQAIDPGLLQAGEGEGAENRRTAVFTARIVPIPAFGTKRVEMEYQERLTVENLQSLFSVPLRPDAYRAQTAGRLSITLELNSAHALRDFENVSKSYPLQIRERTANRVVASMEARNFTFSEDFSIRYGMDPAKRDSLAVLAYREQGSDPGYFEASAMIGAAPAEPTAGPARTIIALFDSSLSMQWEKLERSFTALERLLRSLRPVDKFNVLLFNSEVKPLNKAPIAAAPQAVEQTLASIRSSFLRGGTNLQAALEAAVAQATPDSYIVLIGDGGTTVGGDLRNGKIADWYAARTRQVRPRTFIFAVGDDANIPLFKMLTASNGVLEWVLSTEQPDFKITSFLSKIGRRPVEQLSLTSDPAGNFSLIYPLEPVTYPGSAAAWVGQYKQPGNATFTVRGRREGAPVELKTAVQLPTVNIDHPHLPRTWAKARVDALLEKIEREGEDRATIDEIIRLSRKYKFVTPYTSFLAAPRALLRPRLIRPGDPVLRVRTDPSIVSVVALFPFGLIKPLKYLQQEDTWQTRFLAPVDMPDGTHNVRLVLRDKAGRTFREAKTFVIASKPPQVKIRLEKTQFRRGEAVRLKVAASETSRTVLARMYGVSAVSLRWNPQAAANTGEFAIPQHLAAGKYRLTVTAEDFAHNIGSQEVAIEVVP